MAGSTRPEARTVTYTYGVLTRTYEKSQQAQHAYEPKNSS